MRISSRGPGILATPNCCSTPSRLISTQCSSTLPSTTRLNSMAEKATCLPVGGRPWRLAAVGTAEGHTRRHCVSLGRDVLYSEPKVREGLYEGGGVLPPGLQALQIQGGGGIRDVSYEAGSQDVHFGL